MQVYSDKTGNEYPSWDPLVDAEGNGWSVVIMQQRGKRVFARVEGPFESQGKARNRAMYLRRKIKKQITPKNWKLLGVTVEPIWDKVL